MAIANRLSAVTDSAGSSRSSEDSIHNAGGNDYYRDVSGTVSLVPKDSPSVRIESLTRHSREPITWLLRQPRVALYCWDAGFQRYSLDIGGSRIETERASGSLTLIPPELKASGEFYCHPTTQYRAAFIDLSLFEDRGRFTLSQPLASFTDQPLERSVKELFGWRDDATYSLMAEGWALQAVARIRRIMDGVHKPTIVKGGIPAPALRRVEEYVHSRLHEIISLDELAGIVGLSIRHFARAFQTSTGKTPARFVQERRISRAKEMLAQEHVSITEVALACGFSHAQHFSTSFRREVGMTPSEFRHAHKS